jgi:hypothetical protein
MFGTHEKISILEALPGANLMKRTDRERGDLIRTLLLHHRSSFPRARDFGGLVSSSLMLSYIGLFFIAFHERKNIVIPISKCDTDSTKPQEMSS